MHVSSKAAVTGVLNLDSVTSSRPFLGWTCDYQVSAKSDSGDGVTGSSLAQFPAHSAGPVLWL